MSGPTLRYDPAPDDVGYIDFAGDDYAGAVDYTFEIVPGVLADIYEDEVVGIEFIGLENLRGWLMAAVRMRRITPYPTEKP